MNYLAHVADRIIGRPLMILPAKLELIISVLGERIGAAIDNQTGLDPRLAEAIGANRFVGEPGGPTDNRGRRRMMYRQEGGVAILDVMGSLVNRGAWLGASSGMTSYEGLAAQLDAAVSDPSVRAILLDIDSPGGEATGAFAFYEALRAARERKTVVAQVNDMAASAAYGIAAQADHVVISPSSIVGSIGVVMMHMDRSKALEKQGNKPTLIYAGAHKVDGNAFEPLSASVRNTLQAEVDAFYDRFVEGVAAGRPELSERAIRATEAQTYIGATAIEIGLADKIGSFTETLARLASRSTTGVRSMTNRLNAQTDDPRVYSQAEYDAAIIAARAAERADLEAAHATAIAAARKEALDRVRAIVNCEAAKGREAAALTMALESDIPVDGAAKLLNSIPIVEARAPIPSVAARSAPQLGSDPGSDKPDPMLGWNKAIEKANAQAGVKPQRAA
jgi:signal peptide peptidase SppA